MTRALVILLALVLTGCTPADTRTPGPPYAQKSPMSARVTPSPADTATATPADNCTVTAEALNVRSGPGVEYPVLSAVYAGQVLTVTATVGNWGALSAGWINLRWCK